MKTEKPKVGENRGNAGKGRPKGSKNKTTTKLKDAIMRAFDEVGGQSYLSHVAETDPRTFCTLLGRVLPSEIQAELTGPQGKDLFTDIRLTVVNARDTAT